MKVGDKVLIEVEVKKFNDFTFTDKYFSTYDRREIITQLPIQEGRWMMVSENNHSYVKRLIIGKHNGYFVSILAAKDETELAAWGFQTSHWKYAKEITTKRKLTIQEIAEKFGEDVENIEICQ